MFMKAQKWHRRVAVLLLFIQLLGLVLETVGPLGRAALAAEPAGAPTAGVDPSVAWAAFGAAGRGIRLKFIPIAIIGMSLLGSEAFAAPPVAPADPQALGKLQRESRNGRRIELHRANSHGIVASDSTGAPRNEAIPRCASASDACRRSDEHGHIHRSDVDRRPSVVWLCLVALRRRRS